MNYIINRQGMFIEMVLNNEIQIFFSSNHFIFLTLLKELQN
jgi:hypothetical protein